MSIFSKEKLIKKALSLEKKSGHPLAAAIVEYAQNMGFAAEETNNFRVLPGNGLEAELDGKIITGGKIGFILQKTNASDDMQSKADVLSRSGKTPMLFAEDGKLLGMIATADKLKKDSAEQINAIKNELKLETVMLTGDNERTARAIGVKAGVICNETLDDEAAYQMAKCLYAQAAEMGKGNAFFADMADVHFLVDYTIPVHPGAERFYKEVGLM